jgi:hypothetical protein
LVSVAGCLLAAAVTVEEAVGMIAMTHLLPADPEAIVIEWQSSGGLGKPPDATPDLVVRAGGRVTVGPRMAGGRPAEGRITPRRLQDVLAFALDQHRFFEIDGQALGQRLATAQRRREEPAAGGGAMPLGAPYPDAGATRILIAADGRRQAVEQQGLFAAARDYPEIEALGHLRAIELRLLELAQEIASAASSRKR